MEAYVKVRLRCVSSFYKALCILNIDNSTWYELSVLQAAYAAEILIKARIAEEHPLLIFESFPHSKSINGDQVEIEDLFKNGRTIQWSDLPERLFLTTGIKLPNKKMFDNFGRLRNGIQHFLLHLVISMFQKKHLSLSMR
ncbi:hypothetical protein [Paramaledivibacter caminithermalis]|jgi:hypothetical protein|uniref:Uncharacterized protein n=1 Tax=Paramaledivibacter caminithermalis (strain DSM 15212 / CIP 107654 / DViRD3) TaxID=1121301 RepID=A0A1M6NBK6_PARC5|nr:hypothetical protein [Paramaledivibacter caminithermalis]SHJ93071.1 hypothetical protein SAMN02745912_01654 [Paramaledivibacter caminithermalis DSM 15212]